MKTLQWIPAAEPPQEMTQVLMVGGKYAVAQGVWWDGGKDKKPGFWLQAGESLFHAPWVEWWIPMPEKPANDELCGPPTRDVARDSGTESANGGSQQ